MDDGYGVQSKNLGKFWKNFYILEGRKWDCSRYLEFYLGAWVGKTLNLNQEIIFQIIF